MAKPFAFKQLNSPEIDFVHGQDWEITVSNTVAMMLEEIAKRIRSNAMPAPKTIKMSIETWHLSSRLLADLEYWNGN